MSEIKQTRTVVVSNAEGVHFRAATLIAKLVRKFRAKVELAKGGQRVGAADVLEILSLGAGLGEQLLVEAHGPEAEAALEAVVTLFDHQFDEEIARQLGLTVGDRQDVQADPPAR